MSIWSVLQNRPAVPNEQTEIERLTERALSRAAANQASLQKAKAEAEAHRKREERLASEVAAAYGRTK